MSSVRLEKEMFFFFQAEDGIRDLTVTGVQTCALPISRYSARWRRYRYRFLDRPARPALERGRCWHVRGALDVDGMSLAARTLVGKHDWTTFCSASEPADTRLREMHSASVRRRGDLVELELVAEGFLRGMVRSIAGALAEVGRGQRPPARVGEILRSRDPPRAPRTAPGRGLTLMGVTD